MQNIMFAKLLAAGTAADDAAAAAVAGSGGGGGGECVAFLFPPRLVGSVVWCGTRR